MILPMRAVPRFLICLAISCSLALAAIPAQAVVPQVKESCCAKMKMDAPANDCSHQAPKSNEDKQCCSMCAFCLAATLSTATPFVYPPTGEESFAAFISREHDRSHRPPVPPPRSA